MFRMHKGVDMDMNVATKRVHDAAIEAFVDYDVPLTDVNKDMENHSELE